MHIQAHPHDDFSTPKKRSELAYLVAKLMVGKDFTGETYRQGGDDFRWVVDKHGYWTVEFDRTDAKFQRFTIKHYDNNENARLALMYWVSFHIRATVIIEQEENDKPENKVLISQFMRVM